MRDSSQRIHSTGHLHLDRPLNGLVPHIGESLVEYACVVFGANLDDVYFQLLCIVYHLTLHRIRVKCPISFLYLKSDYRWSDEKLARWISEQAVFPKCDTGPRDAQRVLTHQESGLKASFLTLLLPEGRNISDPLPVKSANIERACEAPLAESAPHPCLCDN